MSNDAISLMSFLWKTFHLMVRNYLSVSDTETSNSKTRSTTENVAILHIFRWLTFHFIVFNRESKSKMAMPLFLHTLVLRVIFEKAC